MGAEESAHVEKTPDDVHPLVTGFLQRITDTQWQQIKSAQPDGCIKTLLAEMMLELTTSLSNTVLTGLDYKNPVVSEEHVASTVTPPLTLSLARSLGLGDDVQCDSVDVLKNLIVTEVTEKVRSFIVILSSEVTPVEPTLYVTPALRLDAMVSHGCQILRAFSSKVRSHTPKAQQSPSPPAQPGTSGTSGTSSAGNKFVTDVISKEVKNLTAPFLENASDCEQELFQSASSVEIRKAATEIKRVVSEYSKCYGCSREMCKASLRISSQMKNLLANQFIKASIYHSVAQLQAKFNPVTRVKDKKATQLLKCIKYLLNMVTGKDLKQHNDFNVFWNLKHISSGKNVKFAEELCDIIFTHITGKPYSDKHAAIYNDIMSKVQSCLGLTSWWLNTQVTALCNKVTHTLLSPGSDTQALTKKNTAIKTIWLDTLQEVKKKVAIRILIEKVFLRIFEKANMFCTNEDSAIIYALFKKTWAKVKDTDVNTSSKTFKERDKVIFRNLSKKWGCLTLLFAMKLQDPVIEDEIVSTFIQHMTQPNENNILMSMYKGIVNILRHRKNVSIKHINSQNGGTFTKNLPSVCTSAHTGD